MAEIKGWFTLKGGTHIPIMEGQSKSEAAQKYINSKHGKTVARLSKKKNKEEKSNNFSMYNSSTGKTVTVTKGDDGKWVDSDGNKYMGYLSKSDVKSYFRGDWKETNVSNTKSDYHIKIEDNKLQVANALKVKIDPENKWKTSKQLYKEQKGIDLVDTAVKSPKVELYNKYVAKNYNQNDKNFSDRKSIDNFAKKNRLHADSLYYMTKVSSAYDRGQLMKSAFDKYLKDHPNSKLTLSKFEDMVTK